MSDEIDSSHARPNSLGLHLPPSSPVASRHGMEIVTAAVDQTPSPPPPAKPLLLFVAPD